MSNLPKNSSSNPADARNNQLNPEDEAFPMDRRQFATLAGASLGNLLTRQLWAEQVAASGSSSNFDRAG